MTLEDRKKEIYSENGNITFCQTGCEFELYNKTTKKSKCNCEVQKNNIETNITKINFEAKNITNSFLKTIKNSNFLVLQCYKLAFNFKDILQNIGRIIMSIILISFIALLFFYIIKDKKKINIYIGNIIQNKIKLKQKQNENKNDKSKNGKRPIKDKNKKSIVVQKRKNKNNHKSKDKKNISEPPQKKKNNFKGNTKNITKNNSKVKKSKNLTYIKSYNSFLIKSKKM